MPTRALLLPGLYDSGPAHWQTHWEHSEPGFVRVIQDDWATPRPTDWVARLDEAVTAHGRQVVLVGHSSSCALIAAWSRLEGRRVKGALLVAPSDSEAPSYPAGPTGFAPMPMARIPFRTILIASTDDEYVSMERACVFAQAWGSRLVDAGALGHINSASNLGRWPMGLALLEELLTLPET